MKSAFVNWQIIATVTSAIFFSYCTYILVQPISTRVAIPADSTAYNPQTLSKLVAKPVLPLARSSVNSTPEYLTFVGDMMLGRSVEVWMREKGVRYPFLHVQSMFGSSTYTVANFEAAIPPIHRYTKAYTTQFSVDEAFIPTVRDSGITHLSLANNHAMDFGQTAASHTRAIFTKKDIVAFGDADNLSSSSITYLTLGSTSISILALQTVYGSLDHEQLKQLLKTMNDTSDLQFAYFHWGTEYALQHTAKQQALAQEVIAQGIDAIIGHHPHVVQDIQLIDNVPVFYSLGNFIFDQYFSDDVQQSLALRLTVRPDYLEFTLVPMSSIGTRAQPHLMADQERELFLKNLAARSDSTLITGIQNGELRIPRILQKP